MSIDSGAEALPRKNRRVAKRNVEGDISPSLRKHVTQAAKQIRGAHKAELVPNMSYRLHHRRRCLCLHPLTDRPNHQPLPV